jgi:hypothetical protein
MTEPPPPSSPARSPLFKLGVLTWVGIVFAILIAGIGVTTLFGSKVGVVFGPSVDALANTAADAGR